MLTLSQKKTLDFIHHYITLHQYSPTMAEIAQGIGIKSRGVIHRYVSALATKGFITIESGCKRNIKLLTAHNNTLALKGIIAAGTAIEAISDNEAIDIVRIFIGTNRYALKVKGESMVGEGIFDGDLVVCEYCQSVAEGKIAVVIIDNQEATLKRVKYNSDSTITLLPANPNYTSVTYPAHRISFQGLYIGLLRFERA